MHCPQRQTNRGTIRVTRRRRGDGHEQEEGVRCGWWKRHNKKRQRSVLPIRSTFFLSTFWTGHQKQREIVASSPYVYSFFAETQLFLRTDAPQGGVAFQSWKEQKFWRVAMFIILWYSIVFTCPC